MVVIGLQETEFNTWFLQSTLNRSLENLSAALNEKTYDYVKGENLNNNEFVMVDFVHGLSQSIVLYVKLGLLQYMDYYDKGKVCTGHLWSSLKGCASLCLRMFGQTYLFMCCHLCHGEHAGQNIKRLREYEYIETNLHFQCEQEHSEDLKVHKYISERFDHVWLLGDLNFRIEGEIQDIHAIVDKPHEYDYIPEDCMDRSLTQYNDKTYKWLWHLVMNDELRKLMHTKVEGEEEFGNIFEGYKEAFIKFKPTYKYKYDKHGTQTYDTKRKPAYVDRILFKCRDNMEQVRQQDYDVIEGITSSDHMPIYSNYYVKIKGKVPELNQELNFFTNLMDKGDKVDGNNKAEGVDTTQSFLSNGKYVQETEYGIQLIVQKDNGEIENI